MEGMKEFPDRYFDLAIVDPPYGRGLGNSGRLGSNNLGKWKDYGKKKWDCEQPKPEYFIELKRVAKGLIIWGGNYFGLSATSCFLVWDKDNSGNYADCELAWTNFDSATRKVTCRWNGMLQYNMANKEQRIHPTQKPIWLYRWCLKNYAQSGWKILDTHVGSASSLIACEWEGFDYVGFELDSDYYAAATKRLEMWRKSRTLELFEREEVMPK